ncbi:ABC transporter ATP-binding protein [Leptolyngbya sp. NIES-3755]|nr:ABC transporter ATP-binding protein [Leptolyngbya sp. NIES-3755]
MQDTTSGLNRVDRQLWKKFWKLAKPYWFSEQRWKARRLLLTLLIFAVLVNGINVGISFIFRNIDTSLAGFPDTGDSSTFWRLIAVYVGLLVIATPIVVLFDFIRERLALRWREWLTHRFLEHYLEDRAYYQINANAAIDNPDQRIADDIWAFSRTSLTFLLIVLSSIITLISFTGVLLSISVTLSLTLIAYAIVGTVVTTWIGRRLVGIRFNQLKREADFRYGLIHVRDNAEAIAFYQGEVPELNQLRRRFGEALQNFDLLIRWERNLGYFTSSYNFLVRALPYLVVAPIYFAGQTDFGAITQAAIAFTEIFRALSIVVTRFEDLTAFAAGIERLSSFAEALKPVELEQKSAIITTEDECIALDRVTVLTPNYQRTLVKDLTLSLEAGEGLVIIGQSGSGKSSLLRAIAGLWKTGLGNMTRPVLGEMLFLPQRPYMVLGTLKAQLLYPHHDRVIDENQLYQVLEQVNLAELPERVGGFEVERDWANTLSLGEQQRLAFARLLLAKPRYAILDEATSALDSENERRLYQHLQKLNITFVSVGHRISLMQYHDYVLKLEGNAHWKLLPTQSYLKLDRQQEAALN